jgi:membrane protein
VNRRQRARSAIELLRLLPHLLRRTAAKAWHDRLLGLSAETAFWQLLSLPSLFLALVATLGYISRWLGTDTLNRTETTLESGMSDAFSKQVVHDIVSPMIHEILHGGRADIISIGFVIALWAGSSATATFVNTITIAYGMRDLRGAVRSRLLALGLFLGSVVIGVIVLPVMVLGPDLFAKIFPDDWVQRVNRITSDLYYPVVVVLLLVGLATLYHLAPPRRLPWHRGLPGAAFALLIFLGGSALLRLYIHFILDNNHAYGTLATPIAALLFFYILALGVLLGAEFNAALEEAAPTPSRQPRILNPKAWRRLDTEALTVPMTGLDNGDWSETKQFGDEPTAADEDEPKDGGQSDRTLS